MKISKKNLQAYIENVQSRYYRAAGMAAATGMAILPGVASAELNAEGTALRTAVKEEVDAWIAWGGGIVTTVVLAYIIWRLAKKIPNKTL